MACIAAISIIASSTAGAANKKIEEVDLSSNAELSTLQSTLQTLERQLADKHRRQRQLQEAFRDTEITIGELAATQQLLSQQQQQLRQQLSTLLQQKKALEEQLRKQRSLIKQQLRATHKWHSHSQLQLFFQQSPEDVNRQLHYLETIHQARQKQILDYRETLSQQRTTADKIASQKKNISLNQQELERQRQELAQLQQRRQQQLQRLTETIASQQQQVDQMRADSKALQELLQRVQHARPRATTSQRFSSAKGQLPWPVDGTPRFYFGQPRPGSDVTWQGVTLTAEAGQPVRAIYTGRVVFADWFQGQGLLIIIDHGEGYMTLYGHNQSLLRSVGSHVGSGETIAAVGNSGGRKESALYFEIRHNGIPSDPALWCKTL